MNKIIQFFLYALLFSGLFLTSCQKEQADIKMKTPDLQVSEELQQNVNKAKILHFVGKLNAAKQPSDVSSRDASLTVDELAFGTEAVLNLYYTRFDDRFSEMDYAELELSVPLNSGVVDDAELAIAYTEIEQAVTDHLSAAPFTNKKVNYVDVIVAEVTDNEATIRVKTTIGDLGVGPSDPNDSGAQPPYFDFGWRCGEFTYNGTEVDAEGRCSSGFLPELDAAKLFKKTLNENYRKDHPFPLIYHGVYGFQVDSEAPIPLFDLPGGSNKYYSAEYDGTLSSVCLSMEDMNLYYDIYDAELALMETSAWQLGHPSYFPTQQQGETGWKMKWMQSVEASTLGYPTSYTVRHIAKVLFMKQIIIYDEGGSNANHSSSDDALSWVEDLLN